MASTKKAKYFCENCGEEVAANARFCPHCGRFFSAVRCPNCGFMGSVNAFKNGCPKCHYAMTPEDIYGLGQVPSCLQSDNKKGGKKKKSRFNKKTQIANKNISSDVPTWLMVLSIIVLMILIVILLRVCD